jgi:lipoprotein NlpD
MTGFPASTRSVRRLRPAFFCSAAIVLAAAIVAAGCGTVPRVEQMRDYHIVRSGETLFTIAWRYGRDYRDLARWNDLGDGSLIYPGQLIKLYPPPGGRERAEPRASPGKRTAARTPTRELPELPSEPPPAWSWPTSGSVVVEFGTRPGTGTGVLISGESGQPVRAAAAGRVVYSGSGLIGYGQLIIVKHNDTYLSAYGHNASLLVQEGEAVGQGQRIATMGDGPGREPRLHFEIRQNGKPVDPRQFLPAR